jgi:CHAT domain-containing protein
MDDFYKYLAAGKDKDEALRLAQLEYFERKGGTNEELHPYYWAAFIPIGDMRPIGK